MLQRKGFFSERRPPRLNGAHCAINVDHEGRTRIEPTRIAGVGAQVIEKVTGERDHVRSVLNTMQGLVVIHEIMCHKKREPYHDV